MKTDAQHKIWLACIVLFTATLVAFWPVQKNDFINYDDPDYVSENPIVQQGITGANIKWAFAEASASNWHPLTWISHMLDCQIFGPQQPGKHHLTSVVLHAASAALLFLLLNKMTGSLWKSAIVAAVFAWHPLRVESVAWISERKDVLSGFFFMLTLLAYAHYAKKPEKVRYIITLVCFAFALMAKPMVVTLPFLLLLLDVWPLGRVAAFRVQSSVFSKGRGNDEKRTRNSLSLSHLLLEKIPFVTLTLASCLLTVWAQKKGGAVKTLSEYSTLLRLENASVSYLRYIKKFFWPNDLAVFYPHPNAWPGWQVSVALALLIVLTFFAIRLLRKAPFIAVGWFWFLGMMVPVIGIVQVGIQSMADRYTYLPMIGFSISLVWGIGLLIERFKLPAVVFSATACTGIAACFFLTNRQVHHWKDSESIFRQALAVTTNNYTAHANLGIALARNGNLAESEIHLRKARDVGPNYAEAYHNLANTLAQLNHIEEARTNFLEAIKLRPDYDAALSNLGLLCAKRGEFEQAITFYSRAANVRPFDPVIQHNLATALLQFGNVNEALKHYSKATELNPDSAQSHFQMGAIFAVNGKRDQAVFHLRETLRINPDHAEARHQLSLLGQ